MLEAALEQMDGIIQGAKYDLPNYFDNFSIQDSPPSATSVNATNNVNEALKNLKKTIQTSESVALSDVDKETRDFLFNWLQNNMTHVLTRNNPPPPWLSETPEDDLSTVEERLLQLETDKDSLQLQVTVLEDQLDSQGSRVNELEKMLSDKHVEVRRMEEVLGMERNKRTVAENKCEEFRAENSSLKLKCARLERDLIEMRNNTPKLSRPTNLSGVSLPISPTPISSPEDVSPTSKKGVIFSDEDGDSIAPPPNDMDTSMISLSGRSTRGLRKILGKIKRSNSGGFEGDRNGIDGNFNRGGMRATASGRLGWSQMPQMKNKRFAEWSVDTLCTWLETIGLGQYCSDFQKNIGTGADLVRLAGPDLETKLNIKHPLHRKKLLLAMQAKVDPNRPDPAGDLDCAWVLRWLDDVGLPQYKETFLEARIDGRMLNLLTVDDLSFLRVTNLLHHLSIKRGIQVMRQNNFNCESLKRRATAEEDGSTGVLLWTNHRVMEWLRHVDLAEYAPNLRGSGVHGGLIILEPKFNGELLASILSIPTSKTLLRRHLIIHFGDLLGRELVGEKRRAESEPNFQPLTPTAKIKSKYNQFTLKRKKSKSDFDAEDCLVCPLSPMLSVQK